MIVFTLFLSTLGSASPAVAQSESKLGPYAVVVNHLVKKDPPISRFNGEKVLISPEFAKGDSLFYNWGDEIKVDDELIESLKRSSKIKTKFPSKRVFGKNGHISKIESFHDLYYYGEGKKKVDAKCAIAFWRPAYSKDKKRCLIRFYYGPSPHGAAGTYLLEFKNGKWKIVNSTISYYA